MPPHASGRFSTLMLGIALLAIALAAPERSIARAAPAGQTPQDTPLAASMLDKGAGRASGLSSQLAELHRADAAARAAGRPVTSRNIGQLPPQLRGALADRSVRIDADGNVQVFIETAGEAAAVAADLAPLGLQVQRVEPSLAIVQGMLPIAALERAAALPSVRLIRPPDYPFRSAGSATTQGDAILNADDLRLKYESDGSGVRVGVMSDGIEGLAAAQASADLPAVNSATCDVIEAAPAGEPANPTSAGAGAEGTAMLEIVHDLAPGAELWFGYFGFNVSTATVFDFMDAVDCLADNVDVIVDDIGFLNNGPYDGTSTISQNAATELNDVSNRVRASYTAVGNMARNHYQEAFVASVVDISDGLNTWRAHRWSATASTTDAGLGLTCTAELADGFCGDLVLLEPGGFMSVFLQWNDPFGASSNDYDLFLQNENTSMLLLASGLIQDGNDNPVESFGWQNLTLSNQNLDIVIARFAGSPRVFDLFINCVGCLLMSGNVHNFNTRSSSVPNNADAGSGVLALGTINAGDPGNDTIASYSSRGPTNDARTKPDATAIDGVSITGSGGFFVPFFGTSAAAPHAAGIAALLIGCNPLLGDGELGDNPAADRTALRTALLSTALDLGTAGTDNDFGAGRLNADAAAVAAGCVGPDNDGDGCSNYEENGAEWQDGGDRDPENPWDFFDVPAPALLPTATGGTRNKATNLQDALSIITYVGTFNNGPANVNGADYDSDLNGNGTEDGVEYDRTPSSNPEKLWRSGPPSGAITLQDALVALYQVGTNCLPAP